LIVVFFPVRKLVDACEAGIVFNHFHGDFNQRVFASITNAMSNGGFLPFIGSFDSYELKQGAQLMISCGGTQTPVC